MATYFSVQRERLLFCLLLLAGFLFQPLPASAQCTPAHLEDRLTPAMKIRLLCLEGSSLMQTFRTVADPNMDRISDVRVSNASDRVVLETLCRETGAMIVIADDLLAGGDGTGKATPWGEVTPEVIVGQRETILKRCGVDRSCVEGVMPDFLQRLGRLDEQIRMRRMSPKAYVEGVHGIYSEVIDKLNIP